MCTRTRARTHAHTHTQPVAMRRFAALLVATVAADSLEREKQGVQGGTVSLTGVHNKNPHFAPAAELWPQPQHF
jgi:hypothetical protein